MLYFQAKPNEIVIKTIKGIYVESSFELVNTGLTTAYIALSCGDYTKAIIQPKSFTLEPGQNIQVTMSLALPVMYIITFSSSHFHPHTFTL